MGIKLTNNAFATLAASINSSATSITLTTGQGARFPTLGAGDYFYATLIDTSNNLEIVKCTARSTDVLTVVRAQEGTTARAYNTGDRIEIRITAQTFLDASGDPANVSDKANTSTGYFDLPSGTTAQRPGSPNAGMVRFNTTIGEPEWYDAAGAQWLKFSQGANYPVEYVVVAGGGGGGSWVGGGGGAGGYRSSVSGESSGGGVSAETALTVNAGALYTVTVGAGGVGNRSATPGPANTTTGTNGSNSVFGSITSLGGGRGGSYTLTSSEPGGSGGGGDPGSSGGDSGTAGQGYAGASGTGAPYYTSGGGGGAGGAGAAGTNTGGGVGGNGGVGVQSSINGTATYRAGGGGGGVNSPGTGPIAGSGGLGGGGNGANQAGGGSVASNGTTNTGGGGGGSGQGSSDPSSQGGNGGSGVVIIRYLGPQRGTGGTVTSAGGYTVHTFTSSGTFTA